jgi:hypothetical protein
MVEQNAAFLDKFGRLPRTADEDPWLGELGDLYPGLKINPRKRR